MTENLYNQLKEFILEVHSQQKKLRFYMEVIQESRNAQIDIHSHTGWYEKEIDDPLSKKLVHYFENDFELPWIMQRYHTARGEFMLDKQGKVYLNMFVVDNSQTFDQEPEEFIQKIDFPELDTYVAPNHHRFTLMMQSAVSPELYFNVNVWTEPLQGDAPPPIPKKVKKACENIMWKIIQPYVGKIMQGLRPIIEFNILVEVQPNGYGKFTVDHITARVEYFPKVFL